MKAFSIALALAASIPAAWSAPIGIAGGTTSVELDPATAAILTGALTITPLGTGTLVGLTATFPITGGFIDPVTGMAQIEHVGSGLGFSDGTDTLDLTDFLIDVDLVAVTGILSGQAALNGAALGSVPLFDIGPGLVLTLRSEAAAALTQVFGVPDFTGAVIGVATTSPTTVPEPATWAALGGALTALAWMRRRAA
ncbi:MAG: PEP-CTERM sorting domain-containing protein [Bryobacteraceae bacterium]|nr:PEP-CTERM sorting domain-containing protein [Bryobacteraceae bacterium]